MEKALGLPDGFTAVRSVAPLVPQDSIDCYVFALDEIARACGVPKDIIAP